MKLPKCNKCKKIIRSRCVIVIFTRKKVSGNVKRKQYYWSMKQKLFYHPKCIITVIKEVKHGVQSTNLK